MEIGEPHTLGAEAVEVWGLNDGIPVHRYVAIALVVGHHQNHVGPGR